MANIRLGWKEILRAAKPGSAFVGCFIALALIGVLSLVIREGVSTSRSERDIVVFENAMIQAVSQPEDVADETVKQWALALRTLAGGVLQEQNEPLLQRAVFQGYATLYKEGIGTDKLRSHLESFFGPLAAGGSRSYAFGLIKNRDTLRKQLKENLFGSATSLSQQESGDRLFDTWPIFPISGSLREAYAVLYGMGPVDARQKHFFYNRSGDILRAVVDGSEGILRTVPEVQEVPALRHLGVTGIGLIALTSVWTWFVYLATVYKIDIRPWHVRWSALTCVTVLFWSLPIVATVFAQALYSGFVRLARGGWAFLTADFGRAVRILFGKRDAGDIALAEADLMSDALDLLHKRLGQIAIELPDLEAARVVEETDRHDGPIFTLSEERDLIEAHVRAFPKSGASAGEGPSVATSKEEDIAGRVAAMRRINPAIPSAPKMKEEKAPTT